MFIWIFSFCEFFFVVVIFASLVNCGYLWAIAFGGEQSQDLRGHCPLSPIPISGLEQRLLAERA